MKNWDEVRTKWVNGSRNEIADWFCKTGNRQMLFRVLREALAAYKESIPNGTSTSGDLVDLLEILNRVSNPVLR